MIFNENEREIVYYSLIAPALLSILGTLFVMTMYLVFGSLRNTSFKLIFFLAIFDFLNAVAFLIPNIDTESNSFSCQFQAFLLNVSSITSIFWTTFMAIFLLRTIKGVETFSERELWIAFITNIFLGVLNSVIPYFIYDQNAYGRVRAWCWIEDEYSLLRNILFIFPLFILVPVNFLIYIRVAMIINNLLKSIESQSHKSLLMNKLLLYPFIIVICYLPYTIKAFLEQVGIETDEFSLTLVSGILRCLHGFFNFCIYGINPAVQKKIKEIFNQSSYDRYNSVESIVSLAR